MCAGHEHAVVFRGNENEILCFQCAVKEAMAGEFVEAEVDTENNFIACFMCGR